MSYTLKILFMSLPRASGLDFRTSMLAFYHLAIYCCTNYLNKKTLLFYLSYFTNLQTYRFSPLFFKLNPKTSITAAPVQEHVISKTTSLYTYYIFYKLCSQRKIAAAYQSRRLQSILISSSGKEKKNRRGKTCE